MISDKNSNRLIVKYRPRSHISEAYRALRTNVEFLNFDKNLKTIMITSPVPQKGIGMTTANFALTLAENGKKVIIVDCDLRNPLIHKIFHDEIKPGLTNVLVVDTKISEVIRNAKDIHANLSYIPAGPVPPNPSGLLVSKKMKDMFEELKKHNDTILVYSAPVIGFSDTLEIANKMDGVILIINSGTVSKEVAIKTKDLLNRAKAKMLGVVLNNIEINQIDYYQYYHSNIYREYFNF